MSNSPPSIKLIIEIRDKFLVDSQRLSVIVNMKEISEPNKRYNMFFSDYVQNLNSKQILIDTTSFEYQISPTRHEDCNVYLQHQQQDRNFTINMIQWNAKNSFVFDCSIKFECHDESIKEQSFRNEAVLSTNTIASLHENKNFADLTFIVRGQEFKVHKNLLNEASPVFKSISHLDWTRLKLTAILKSLDTL